MELQSAIIHNALMRIYGWTHDQIDSMSPWAIAVALIPEED